MVPDRDRRHTETEPHWQHRNGQTSPKKKKKKRYCKANVLGGGNRSVPHFGHSRSFTRAFFSSPASLYAKLTCKKFAKTIFRQCSIHGVWLKPSFVGLRWIRGNQVDHALQKQGRPKREKRTPKRDMETRKNERRTSLADKETRSI